MSDRAEVRMKVKISVALVLFMLALAGLVWGEEIDMDRLIPAIIQCESSNNPQAFNKRTGAIGLMQITPVVLKEWNDEYWNMELNKFDLYDYRHNIATGRWYLEKIITHYLPHYGLDVTLDNLLLSWHLGPKDCFRYRQGKRRLGPRTKRFLWDVRKGYVNNP